MTPPLMPPMPPPTFGALLRDRRRRRRMSQLDLALAATVSARHVSFLETGRSAPSRTMVLRLAAVLDLPHRDRNRLLVAAGLAPAYAERDADAPALSGVRAGVRRVLDAYHPYPCVVVDGSWRLLEANGGAGVLLDGVAPHLLESPNALRIALHPDGMAPRIRNLAQWRTHLVTRLRREVAAGGSAALTELLHEICSYPGGFASEPDPDGVAVLLEFSAADGREMRLLSTVTTFGTALDLTVAELSIEAFLPADDATAAALRATPDGGVVKNPESPGPGREPFRVVRHEDPTVRGGRPRRSRRPRRGRLLGPGTRAG